MFRTRRGAATAAVPPWATHALARLAVVARVVARVMAAALVVGPVAATAPASPGSGAAAAEAVPGTSPAARSTTSGTERGERTRRTLPTAVPPPPSSTDGCCRAD